jgi:hypothetical protein
MHAVIEGSEDENPGDLDIECNNGYMKIELVATGLHGIRKSKEGGDGGSVREILKDGWRSNWRKDIHWLGGRGHQEIAFVHLAVRASC